METLVPGSSSDTGGGRDVRPWPDAWAAAEDAPMTKTMKQQRIVVGVDGSEPSRKALRWAIEQARTTGATVEAVCAWELPASYGWALVIDPDDLAKAADEVLTETVAQVAGEQTDVTIRPFVIASHPASALVQQAADADLLVVGSRGHGGFVGGLLGSVSQYCVHHAPCPVVVVRDRPR
jgi:nucleotide-binding universal stress UspA family protein